MNTLKVMFCINLIFHAKYRIYERFVYFFFLFKLYFMFTTFHKTQVKNIIAMQRSCVCQLMSTIQIFVFKKRFTN